MMKNVLIVDDSAIDRKFFSSILKKTFNTVNIIESDDSLQVVSSILENDIDLCILDIMMPEKDGYQVLKEIKENPIAKNIPVIICTGVYDLQSIERVLSLGATDFFMKPLSEQDIKISLPLKVKNALKNYENLSRIHKLSFFDTLTNVYNRKFYEKHLSLIDHEDNLPISLAIFDINGLKIVNERYGFTKGDEYLKKFAKMLTDYFPDGVISRIGGDEFAIIMPNTSYEKALHKILSFFRKSKKERIESINFSVSYGLSSKDTPGQGINEVIKNAEDNLFGNKLYEGSSIRNKTINVVLNILYEKNQREKEHSDRVSEYAQKIAMTMGLDEMNINFTWMTAILHDIGKIAVDESILNKDGKLTDEEYKEIQRHPEIGFRILQTIPEMMDMAQIVLSHHEWYNGAGYPRGLVADEIPLIARIISIADAYDAMTSPRTYRKAMTSDEAIKELTKYAGTQFDPEIVEIFVANVVSSAS